MLIINALLATILGAFIGRFMAMTVHFLPPILLEGCDKGREPRDIVLWFFKKPYCWLCFKPQTGWEQAPIIGYFINHGKCRACHKTVGILPYVLELGIALLFGLSVLFFPVGISLCFVLGASCILVCCFITDFIEGILPDQLTYALLWLGLLASLNPVFVAPSEAIFGAFSGYVIFWFFNVIYRYFRGFDGMFPGDFKLNAALGACLGLESLIAVLIISFGLMVVITFGRYLIKEKNKDANFLYQEVPYACSTAIVGIVALFYLLSSHV